MTHDLSPDLGALLDAVAILRRAESAAVTVHRPWEMCYHAKQRIDAEIAAYFAQPAPEPLTRADAEAWPDDRARELGLAHSPDCACTTCDAVHVPLDVRVTSLAFDDEPGGPEPHPPGCGCGYCRRG